MAKVARLATVIRRLSRNCARCCPAQAVSGPVIVSCSIHVRTSVRMGCTRSARQTTGPLTGPIQPGSVVVLEGPMMSIGIRWIAAFGVLALCWPGAADAACQLKVISEYHVIMDGNDVLVDATVNGRAVR